ncbi:hypothetical protein KCP74_10050 [Salmonella enterica subsp. enterica]|nr:hypothetical protein KCP74_10050 [Salmonella enterica subsp. enterica]
MILFMAFYLPFHHVILFISSGPLLPPTPIALDDRGAVDQYRADTAAHIQASHR